MCFLFTGSVFFAIKPLSSRVFSEVDTWDLVDFRTLTISAAVRYWGLLCKNIRISYSRCLS